VGGPIVLLTDFGLTDTYVGQMKGAILTATPNATIVDLTHEIEPHNVGLGALQLAHSVEYFPVGSIFVAVVDPGVGTARLPVAVGAGGCSFVGPDNGILVPAIATIVSARADEDPWILPPTVEAIAIESRLHRRGQVSATFHGRDIFGPAAAALSCGVPLGELGRSIPGLVAPAPSRIGRTPLAVTGSIIHIDRFGNAITNLRATEFAAGDRIVVADTMIDSLSPHYQAGRGPLAIVGSTGYIEIALSGLRAADVLGIEVGAAVVIERRS
jgi:hypothetical protein